MNRHQGDYRKACISTFVLTLKVFVTIVSGKDLERVFSVIFFQTIVLNLEEEIPIFPWTFTGISLGSPHKPTAWGGEGPRGPWQGTCGRKWSCLYARP